MSGSPDTVAGGRRDGSERELIRTVLESWAEIDLRRGRGIAEYFTEDGVFDLGTTRYVGRSGIKDAFQARIERGPRTARHLVTNLRALVLTEDRAELMGYMVLYGSDGDAPLPLAPPAMVGEIYDTFVRDGDGPWLIEERRFEAAFLSTENPSPFLPGGPGR